MTKRKRSRDKMHLARNRDPLFLEVWRQPSPRIGHPRIRRARGAPSSRHYRRGHVEHCVEVLSFASIKKARRQWMRHS